MSDKMQSSEPRIVDYGPFRLVGISRICQTSEECHNVWADENGFQAHSEEIRAGAGQVPYFALCRCAAGAPKGAFEYIAAMPLADDTPVPDGMAEFGVPCGKYAAFPVAGLHDIGRVWGYTGEWFAAHPEWQGFCDGNPDGCGCVENPSFELYPPGFDGSGELFVYVPVRPAEI